MHFFSKAAGVAALAAICGAACGKVGKLTTALGSPDEKQCESAAKALGALGPKAASAAQAMLDVVVKQRRRFGSSCWMTVVDELPKLGPDATSLLLTALGDKRRSDAAYVLASIGAPVLTKVTAALAAPTTAEGAATAIGLMGKAGAPALPKLREARDANLISHAQFLSAISWLRVDETVPDFAAALGSWDPEVRSMAAQALKDFVARSPEAVSALARVLVSGDDRLRSAAARSLVEAGPMAVGAVPWLVRALQDPLPIVRASAAATLANIGPDAGGALAELRSAADRGLIPGYVTPSAVRKTPSR